MGRIGSAEPCRSDAVWRAISVEGIEWPESTSLEAHFPPASIPSGWYQGLVYLLRPPLQLMTFEPCANVWHTVKLRFTVADLEAALGSIESVQWEQDRFVVRPPSTAQADQKMAQIKAGADSFEVVPFRPVRPPTPDWPLPPLATQRWPSSARTAEYWLEWGGVYVNDATKISPSDPKSVPAADGKIYSFASGAWRATSGAGAPSARYLPKLAPLAERFFVWGGFAE
ncbi:MAG TPA: hypothetical protein VGC79_10420, partial [Polyangiaceae bacterium]